VSFWTEIKQSEVLKREIAFKKLQCSIPYEVLKSKQTSVQLLSYGSKGDEDTFIQVKVN
jgi:hypothetical protein